MTTSMTAQSIGQRIYFIRGQKVMLDRDLATLYGVETRVLNQAVKRNADHFPEDFMVELTRDEIMRISQSVISSGGRRASLKFSKRVLAFTEHGAVMLANVLRSRTAVQASIRVVRAFNRLREMAALNRKFAAKLAKLEEKVDSHDAGIQSLFDAIRRLMAPPDKPARQIGFRP